MNPPTDEEVEAAYQYYTTWGEKRVPDHLECAVMSWLDVYLHPKTHRLVGINQFLQHSHDDLVRYIQHRAEQGDKAAQMYLRVMMERKFGV